MKPVEHESSDRRPFSAVVVKEKGERFGGRVEGPRPASRCLLPQNKKYQNKNINVIGNEVKGGLIKCSGRAMKRFGCLQWFVGV